MVRLLDFLPPAVSPWLHVGGFLDLFFPVEVVVRPAGLGFHHCVPLPPFLSEVAGRVLVGFARPVSRCLALCPWALDRFALSPVVSS